MQKIKYMYSIMMKFEHPIIKLFSIGVFVSILLIVKTPYVDMLICLALILTLYNFGKGINEEVGFELADTPFLKIIFQSLIAAIFGMGIIYGFGKPIIELITGVKLNLSIYYALRGNTQFYINMLLIGILIGGFVEEILFRSFLLKQIKELIGGKIGAIIGLLISAAFFGYLHQYQGITGQLITGLTGFYLGLIYLYNKGRIWHNILTHAFINIISITVIYTGFY